MQLRITLELAFLYQVHGRKDVALAHYEKGAPPLGQHARQGKLSVICIFVFFFRGI